MRPKAFFLKGFARYGPSPHQALRRRAQAAALQPIEHRVHRHSLDTVRKAFAIGVIIKTDVRARRTCPQTSERPQAQCAGLIALETQPGLRLRVVLTDDELAGISEVLTPDVRDVLTVGGSIKARAGAGGTALPRVLEQIAALRKIAPKHEG